MGFSLAVQDFFEGLIGDRRRLRGEHPFPLPDSRNLPMAASLHNGAGHQVPPRVALVMG
jgi:hypothetical protein